MTDLLVIARSRATKQSLWFVRPDGFANSGGLYIQNLLENSYIESTAGVNNNTNQLSLRLHFNNSSMSYRKNLVKRGIANIIDYCLLFFFGMFLLYLLGESNAEDGYSADGGAAAIIFFSTTIAWFILFPVFEGIRGQSVGKQALGLLVVSETGEELGLRRAFLRRILDFMEMSTYGLPSIISILVTEEGKRVGDFLAKSKVISNQYGCVECKTHSSLSMEEMQLQAFKCPECGARNSFRSREEILA